MKSKLRWFGAAVLLFNLWLIGRYSLSGTPALLMTIGFAIAYELVVVGSVGVSEHQNLPEANSHSASSNEPHDRPRVEPQRTIEELANEFGITLDGQTYRYKDFSYERLSDAVAYAKIDRSRVVTCK